MDLSRLSFDSDRPIFDLHAGDKIAVSSRIDLSDAQQLARIYTPCVARVCQAIVQNPAIADEYTWISNTVAVVTDGSAVLGLGDIGPVAAIPVMAGKATLFERFGAVNAVPICLASQDSSKIIETIEMLAPSFAGINLDDISSPRCFKIEQELDRRLSIPVFHDDQHGTAIVVLVALLNALKLTGRNIAETRIVISGADAAGVATYLLLAAGAKVVSVVDRKGLLDSSRDDLTQVKSDLSRATANRTGRRGHLSDVLDGADVFIGLSRGEVAGSTVKRMSRDAIILALAKPVPEVHPDVARQYAQVVATGHSDFPNQINNSLVFQGSFRGALDSHASSITLAMKLAAALAGLVSDDLRDDYIIPSMLDVRCSSESVCGCSGSAYSIDADATATTH